MPEGRECARLAALGRNMASKEVCRVVGCERVSVATVTLAFPLRAAGVTPGDPESSVRYCREHAEGMATSSSGQQATITYDE